MGSIKKTQRTSASDQKYETEIVIAGGGLSGLSAALTAAERGIKAIVLEKLHFLGGAGLFPCSSDRISAQRVREGSPPPGKHGAVAGRIGVSHLGRLHRA